jgi:hypothetical protein
MSIEGCDYSFARPDLACLARNGIRFAARYTSIGPSGKNLDPAEAHDLLAAGLDIVTVFEESAGHALGGRTAGIAAARASEQLGAACGMPVSAVHYMALDVDPRPLTAAQWQQAAAYFSGAAEILGPRRVGVYGGYLAIDRLVPSHAAYGWQTYAWSGTPTRWHPAAVLQQYRNGVSMCAGTVDLDRALQADYGQWNPKEADVPLSEAEWTRLQGLIDQRADTTEASLKAKIDQVAGLLFRGDLNTTDGGTHKDNLKAIRTAVLDSGVTLSDAQVELLGAKLHLAGMPSYSGTVELSPKEATP